VSRAFPRQETAIAMKPHRPSTCLSLIFESRIAGLIAQQPAYQPPPEITFQTDVEYARAGDHRLLLDLALPQQPKNESLPLIVFNHGGGWMSGDKNHAWRANNWNYAASSLPSH
jgi:acetyl esterase/lipase